MDQTTPPTSQQTITTVSTTNTKKTGPTLQESKEFFNVSQIVLKELNKRTPAYEKEISKLSLLAQQHAELSNRLKTLEDKVEEQNKSCAELTEKITALQSNQATFTNAQTQTKEQLTHFINTYNGEITLFTQEIKHLQSDKTELENNCKILSFKIYTGGGLAALLFIYFWYVTHK